MTIDELKKLLEKIDAEMQEILDALEKDEPKDDDEPKDEGDDAAEGKAEDEDEDDEERSVDYDEIEKRIDALISKRAEVVAEIREKEERAAKVEALKKVKDGGEVRKFENGGNTKMNEKEMRAKSLSDTGKMEMRAVLSTGQIATPEKAGGINGLAEAVGSIVNDVEAVALTGAGAYKVAYKVTDAVADAVTDGEEVGGTGAAFDYVTINPAEWGVLDEISKQVAKLTPLDYETAVEESALIALKVYAENQIFTALSASKLVEEVTAAIDADYLRTLLINFKAIAGKGEPCLYLCREDLAAIGKVRGTNEKKALFEIAFDPGTTMTGRITEGGLSARFSISDKITAGTQYFGQPKTIVMPMWDNYLIETDEGGDYFKRNMIGIRGLQTANADLAAYHGMQKVTNA